MASLKEFGRYRLEKLIGHGALGAVYRAEDEVTHQPVAVKVLPAALGTNGEYARRFLNEARLAQQIDHPNVVRVHDFGRRNGHYFLAMDYVDGESCKASIQREGRLPWRKAVEIVEQVAEGLAAAAEQGIIHRDIKPENVLIDPEGRIRIADLGLAKEEGVMEPMPSDTSLGTPDYMSPEQVNNSEAVDYRSDIYSLGATLFHMLCGKAPYTGRSAYEVMVKHVSASLPSPRRYAPDLPDELCDVMRKMMAQDPSDRYQSYEELLNDLRALLAGQPVAAHQFDKESLLGRNGVGPDERERSAARYLWVLLPALCAIAVLIYLLLR
ncbi:MAG: serine/threonine-protein kinase [Armatimonadota bacterium]|jgi:serine/threonine-protein kinase